MKIKIDEGTTLEELSRKIDSGYRFISYQYCISLFFAVTLQKFSTAFLIDEKFETGKGAFKYNLISLLFGWWGLPWGPIYTIKAIKLNNRGGLDVTEDILLNITDDSLVSREVELNRTNQMFSKPDKWDLKAFRKSLFKDFEFDMNVECIIVGTFINTDHSRPVSTIGISIRDEEFDQYVERMQQSLRKQFVKHARFEFLDLNNDYEMNQLLLKQGEVLLKRGSCAVR